MKKLLIALIGLIFTCICVSCNTVQGNSGYRPAHIDHRTINHNGHNYVVFTTYNYLGTQYKSGIFVIHDPDCQCNKK